MRAGNEILSAFLATHGPMNVHHSLSKGHVITFKLELKFDWSMWRQKSSSSRVSALATKKILHFKERSFLDRAPCWEAILAKKWPQSLFVLDFHE